MIEPAHPLVTSAPRERWAPRGNNQTTGANAMPTTNSEAPPRSSTVFHAIAVGAVVAVVGIFGGPLIYLGYTQPLLLPQLIVGGTFVFLGTSFVGSGAPRIYDPSRSMTVDHVERGYARHDGSSVQVERVTGSSEVRYSRSLAIRATVTGIALCVGGLLVGLLVRF